jgi:hypothetical protein
MNEEIHRQIVEHDRKYSMDLDAMILWTLHCFTDWDKDKLRAFWDECFKEHQYLRDFYELNPEDDDWLYRFKLKDMGIDIEEWYKEVEEKENSINGTQVNSNNVS